MTVPVPRIMIAYQACCDKMVIAAGGDPNKNKKPYGDSTTNMKAILEAKRGRYK
jgi:hypothetical protein